MKSYIVWEGKYQNIPVRVITNLFRKVLYIKLNDAEQYLDVKNSPSVLHSVIRRGEFTIVNRLDVNELVFELL